MNKKYTPLQKSIKLSDEKKQALWSKIDEKLSFFENDVIISQDNRHRVWEQDIVTQSLYPKRKNMFITIITALSILFAWGASFAAESSLPGEFLYPVKIHVNENIESAFTFGAENEAELQLERIEERLLEQSELSAQWKLSSDIENSIQLQISHYVREFEEDTKEIENKNDIDTSISLRLKLESLIPTISSSNWVEAQTDIQWNINSWDVETQSNSSVGSEINIDTQGTLDTLIDASVKAEWKIDTTIGVSWEAVNDTAVRTSSEIDSQLEELIEALGDIDVNSDTSVQWSTNVNNNDSNTQVETIIEATSWLNIR